MTAHQQPNTSPVSFRANVKRLPAKGMPVLIEADAAQRAALAEIHGLLEVKRYTAKLLVAPWKRNGVQVTGTVDADIVQACVVTLDPIDANVTETIDTIFLPQDSKLGRLGFEGGGEILLDAEGDDGPETFSGDSIDVGALAEELFGLGIDPYPRKPDAKVEPALPEERPESSSGPLQEKLSALLRKD